MIGAGLAMRTEACGKNSNRTELYEHGAEPPSGNIKRNLGPIVAIRLF